MINGGTWTVDGGTRMIDGGNRTVDGGTLMVTGGTLTVGGGTQMSDDQHGLGSAVASTSRSRHHQAKQHPHIC
jgi:hypothetical protein